MAACGGIRMIEFFSGIGGMRYAVENSIKQSKSSWSLTSCQAYDISLHANNTYRQNFPHDTSPVCTKLVEQLKPKDLDGKADLWTMSPPCQPFTTTRGSKSLDKEDKRCNGFKGIITLLTEIQDKPKYILLENVKGFSTSQMIQEWYACLHQNGYSYKQYLVSPVQIGIPNHRQRCYILCERSDRWKDATEIEQDIVIPAEEPNRKQQQHVVGDYLDTSLSDEGLKDYLVPDSVLQKDWARQVGVVANMDRATHCFTAGYGRIFHRATGSLLLLRAPEDSLAESPLDRSDMMKYSNRLRRFTPKELLALFGFPRTFEFPEGSNLGQQYKLIGNSINVTVVTFLMKELLFGQTESTESLSVGGTKGHVSEEIQGNLLQLYQNYRWKMIPNCTGRHTCRDHDKVSSVPPLELLRRIGIEKKCKGSTTNTTNGDYELKEYHFELPERADKVCVIPLDTDNETGIITFIKEERTAFIHTLNTPSGFRRKLARIGITVSTDDVLIDDGFQTHKEGLNESIESGELQEALDFVNDDSVVYIVTGRDTDRGIEGEPESTLSAGAITGIVAVGLIGLDWCSSPYCWLVIAESREVDLNKQDDHLVDMAGIQPGASNDIMADTSDGEGKTGKKSAKSDESSNEGDSRWSSRCSTWGRSISTS